ncbi:DUF927 domain-containing protein, partial [Streptomyces sp. NPDC007063]|uniref:DUF927 domain-containing protein n=1 Tax=Streptomyces sp. NPDC007063 TaxID=3364772 RepID=UPI0036895513
MREQATATGNDASGSTGEATASPKGKKKDGSPAGAYPIPGMRPGWYYRPAGRAILHQPTAEGPVHLIGTVPRVTGLIVHLTDDGQDVRTEYQIVPKRGRKARIVTEDDLDKGTWASKCGMRRPTGGDERHAYARMIRDLADASPELPARTYYDPDTGDLILPDAEAQQYGYRTVAGTEKAALEAWEEIGYYATQDPKAALVLGSVFSGLALDSLDVLAHVLNMVGPGQQGKSTMLVTCSAALGNIKPRAQQIMMTWNASKQGTMQGLRQRGYLPMALDEHSSSGRTVQESSREISQIVAGCIRAMGGADGSPKEIDGFWHSILLSSSNAPLRFTGQTEDLASRLHEIEAPFFPNLMLDAEGSPVSAGSQGAEHLSKRLKRLAKGHGGWPLEWAVRSRMFTAASLAGLKRLHLDLCAKYRPQSGGIPATIAEIHCAWVVGAHMLGHAIGVPELGPAAERHLGERMSTAVQAAEEANVPEGERLWGALEGLRLDSAAFPSMHLLPERAAEGGANRPKGFMQSEEGPWWVLDSVVKRAASEAEVSNLAAALQHLDSLGVHRRGDAKNAQRLLPKPVRAAGLGVRMHCFDVQVADQLFAPSEEDDDGAETNEFREGNDPGNDPGTTGVVPQNGALTSSGTTGTTGTTSELVNIWNGGGTTEVVPQGFGVVPAPAGPVDDPPAAAAEVAVPPMPAEPPVVLYPAAVEEVTDRGFAALVERAERHPGRTLSATRFGVLGGTYEGVRLHLPNRAPVELPVEPGSVHDTAELMQAYNLKTLWLHASALPALGLPDYTERQELGAEQTRAAEGLTSDQMVPPTRSWTPVAHPWADPAGGLPVAEVKPAGLTSWMTLLLGDGAPGLTVSVPAWETRMDKPKQNGRGGFGGAASAEELLDALMVWLTSTLHGTQEHPRVTPYYRNPNRTGEDFAGGREREDVRCEAIRRQEVPPALGVRLAPLLVPQQWHRPLSEEEVAAGGWV